MGFSAVNMETMRLLNTIFETLREMIFHSNFLSSQPIDQIHKISESLLSQAAIKDLLYQIRRINLEEGKQDLGKKSCNIKFWHREVPLRKV